MSVSIKEKRIEFRVSNEAKETLIKAAKLSNLSLSSYIISVCLKQAKIDLGQIEIITLNNDERDQLLKSLNNPPKPTKELKNLLK